jgi:hypothetical protein
VRERETEMHTHTHTNNQAAFTMGSMVEVALVLLFGEILRNKWFIVVHTRMAWLVVVES